MVLLHDGGTPNDASDDWVELTLPENFSGETGFDYTISDGTGGLVTAHAGIFVG
jgi:hypothetical protein